MGSSIADEDSECMPRFVTIEHGKPIPKCRGETIVGPPNGVSMVFQSFALPLTPHNIDRVIS
jgi:hypothetical protein